MKSNMIKGLVTGAVGLAAVTSAAQANELFVYNWSDYIAEDTIANFEKETGIKVTYDVYDSNEVLEAKLLAGNSGYDIVAPSGAFLQPQIQAGIYQPLDLSKLPNHKDLDPGVMKNAAALDPGNQHAIPYLWGTTGLGYNVDMIKARLGDDAPVDSWDLIFKPENAAKLADCGIAILDAPTEVMPIAMNYTGAKDVYNPTKAELAKASDMLSAMRPHVRYFHSSQYIDDIANGEICVTLGWVGDIAQGAIAGKETGNNVAYYIPKEGTLQWGDFMVIPNDARNVDNAHKFLNYLMRGDVMANITNYIQYPNAVTTATPLVDKAVSGDKWLYPTPDVMATVWSDQALKPKVRRQINRAFTKLKTGT